jgi:dTDP-4-dehydrorhamnose 3,5-epimerase
MKFLPLELGGAYLIELEPHRDERGFFARTWCREELEAHGLDPEIAQCSLSRNERAGTLRGLHFQRPPQAETKLVHCARGAIFDVIVDLRPGSPTCAWWFGAELTEERGNAMYVPEGFAHGFQTLTDNVDVLYMISRPYAPAAAGGVRWDDPAFQIDWPEAAERTISDRDRGWPDYRAGSSIEAGGGRGGP